MYLKNLSINILILAIFFAFASNSIEFHANSFTKVFFIENIKYLTYILLFLSFYLYIRKDLVNKKDINNISIIVILTFVFLTLKLVFIDIELEAYIKIFLILPFFFYNNIDLKYKKQIYLVLTIFIIFTITYSYIQNFVQGFSLRAVFNSCDPNISGMYLLLGFYLARKINSKILMIIFFTLGILTLSRNFLLAIFILYLFSFIKRMNILNKLLKVNFVTILILFNIIVLGVSYGFKYIDFSEGSGQDTSRLTNIADESNAIRFQINRNIMEELFSDTQNFIFGLGSDYPINKDYDIGYKSHNGFIDFLGMYGFVYTLLYLVLLYLIVNKDKNFQNIEYVYSYAIFSLFLPGLLGGVYLILFLFILRFKSSLNMSNCLERSC